MAASFKELTGLYQSIASSVTKTKNYFSSDEYRKLEQLTEIYYTKIGLFSRTIIDILQGVKKGDEINLPGIENKICFYNRILKQQPETLPSEVKKAIDDIIDNSFSLGLISHLFLYECLSRDDIDRVDIKEIMNELVPDIMSSSGKMRKYNRKLNTIPH
jgi:hypothetical protein